MKRLLFAASAVISFIIVGISSPTKADDGLHKYQELAALVQSESIDKKRNDTNPKIAVLCFKTGEQVSGLNKICYYNCLGSQAAITIKAFQLCPLSINR